jgi:hypothetical protein
VVRKVAAVKKTEILHRFCSETVSLSLIICNYICSTLPNVSLRAGDMVQTVENLLCKGEALSSNPSPARPPKEKQNKCFFKI